MFMKDAEFFFLLSGTLNLRSLHQNKTKGFG